MKSDCYKLRIPVIQLLFLQFFLISFFSFAQKSKEEKQIDVQIQTASDYALNFKTKELLQISKDILSKSEKSDYKRGLAQGNYYRALVLFHIGNYHKSIQYVKKSLEYTSDIEKDAQLHAQNYNLLGANYNRLELFTLASENIKKSIAILNKIETKDNKTLYTLSAGYTELSYTYDDLKESDSAYYFLKKQRKLLDKMTSKNIFRHRSLSDINMGNYFYMANKNDSARHYYTQAISVLEGKGHLYEVPAILGLGSVDLEQNKVDDALQHFLQAKKLMKEGKSTLGLSQAYQGLEMAYEKKGDYKNAKEYQLLYKRLDDSVAIANKIQRDSLINEVIKFEKEEQEQISNQRFMTISSVVGFIVILSSIGIFYFIRRKRKELITEKENIIHQKEEENHDLKQKVNESFEEVVQLAKDNSPEFFTRFREVYPHVVEKILQIDPQLRVTELTLCAYFFLGFTPKDVALYTFKSVHTVRNRRQNLRNKLNVPADESFDLWFKNL
jgi:tetratricopeptide (TPR) repeat protein